LETFTEKQVKELLKQYFDPEIIVDGIVYYLKVEKSRIKINETENAFSFLIPIDERINLIISYNAGVHRGTMRDDYPEYLAISAGTSFQYLKAPSVYYEAHYYKMQVNDLYKPKFKMLNTFLYYEFQKLKIDISRKGFSNLSEIFYNNAGIYWAGPKEYDPSKITWVEFVEKKREELNPKKEIKKHPPTLINNYQSGVTNSKNDNIPAQNSGCLIYIVCAITGITFSIYSII
jgi:hypothetical protein